MSSDRVTRINELARLSKTRPLTDAEKAEQEKLRREYLAEFRKNMVGTLENTYLQRPDGQKEKLKPKE